MGLPINYGRFASFITPACRLINRLCCILYNNFPSTSLLMGTMLHFIQYFKRKTVKFPELGGENCKIYNIILQTAYSGPKCCIKYNICREGKV